MASKSLTKDNSNGGQPEWDPTQMERDTIEGMAGIGMTRDEIAEVYQIDPKTLMKHCGREMKLGKAKINQRVAATLVKQATGTMPPIIQTFRDAEGNILGSKETTQRAVPSVGIFFAKVQMGWSTDVPAGGGGQSRPSGVLAVPVVAEDEWLKIAEKQQRDLIAKISRSN